MARSVSGWFLLTLLLSEMGCSGANTVCGTYGFTLDNSNPMGIKQSAVLLSAAESFKVPAAATFKTMYLPLIKEGTFTAGSYLLTLTIESDNTASASPAGNNADGPSGTPISGYSATLDPSNVTTTKESYLFTFSSPTALTAGTMYWLRLNASYPANGTNYIRWTGWQGANGFSGGSATQEITTNVFSDAAVGALQALDFTPGC